MLNASSELGESVASSAAWWAFFSWLSLAFLQFFVKQFIADSRTRDAVARVVTQSMTLNFHTQSLGDFFILLLWASSAWAVWLRGAWALLPGVLIFYVLVLLIDALAWLALWDRYNARAAGVVLGANTLIAAVLMFYAFSVTSAALLLLPYAVWQCVQGINFYRFGMANLRTEFPRRAVERLRENSRRITANAFFEEIQTPADHLVATHETVDDGAVRGPPTLDLPNDLTFVLEDDE